MKNSPPIGDGDKIESTWQIENFSCDYVLIPSNIRGHSKLSSTNVEQPTIFRNKKRAKIGEYRIEIGRVRCGFGIYCFIHSPTQQDSIEWLTSLLGTKPQKRENTKPCTFKRNLNVL